MLTESDVTGRQLPGLRRRRAGTAYYGERRKQDAEMLRLSENGSGLLGERGVWKLISGGGWAAGDWVNRRNPEGRQSVQVSLVSLEHCSLVRFIYSALESWLNRSRVPEAEKIRRVIQQRRILRLVRKMFQPDLPDLLILIRAGGKAWIRTDKGASPNFMFRWFYANQRSWSRRICKASRFRSCSRIRQ